MHIVGVRVRVFLGTDPVIDVHVLVWVRPLSLISVPIAVAITMYVHGKEIVVQRSTCSSIGAKWHITIIPVVNVLDGLSLVLRVMRAPIMMIHFVYWSAWR